MKNQINAESAVPEDRLLNKRQLAMVLGVSTRTLNAYMKKGLVGFIKLGRTVRFRYPAALNELNRFRVN
jgi:hypothetical protein